MLIDPKLRADDLEARSIMDAALQLGEFCSPEEAGRRIEAMIPRRVSQGVYLAEQRGSYFFGEPAAAIAMGELREEVWLPVVDPERRPSLFVRHDGTRVPWEIRFQERTLNDQAAHHLLSGGVCDSPEQLISLYRWDEDPRRLCLLLTEVRRPEQPSWRWDNWGIYHGTQPRCAECLGGEAEIDRVYVFSIYQLGAATCQECFGQRRTYDTKRDPGNRFARCPGCTGRGCIATLIIEKAT